MQPSTPRKTRQAPSGVQSLQALRVEVKCLERSSASSPTAGGQFSVPAQGSPVGEAAGQVAQLMASSGFRMCRFSTQRNTALQSGCQVDERPKTTETHQKTCISRKDREPSTKTFLRSGRFSKLPPHLCRKQTRSVLVRMKLRIATSMAESNGCVDRDELLGNSIRSPPLP